MYKALYRSYRPEVFEEVLGQEHVIRILQNQVAADQVSHAYLFCGTRGTGKTTIARLLAKAVNCTGEGARPCGRCANCRSIMEGSFMDLIEIDAASNNGVDNIRELRESVNYPPVVGRKKVYIMDEVHMLSPSAYNALLKTLEEPPENVMFILCTTEPEKLPATILSRCVRMDFRRVSEQALRSRLAEICSDRGISVDESGLGLIAQAADGSVRDGLSILEQCISGRSGQISREDVLDAIGTVGEEDLIALTDAVMQRHVADGLLMIEDMLRKGRDARQIIQGWMGHYRNLLLVKFLEDPAGTLSMSLENVERVRMQAERLEIGAVTGAIRELSQILYDARRSTQPRVLLEMVFVKLAAGDGFDEEMRQVTYQPQQFEEAFAAAKIQHDLHGQQPAAPQYGQPAEPAPMQQPAAPQYEQPAEPAPMQQPAAPQYEQQAEPAPMQQPAAPQYEQPAPQPDPYAMDLNSLWNAFLDRGERQIGAQFFFIRGRAVPESLEDGVLRVRVRGAARQYVEDNRNMLSALLSQVAGKMTLLLPVGDDEPAPQQYDQQAEPAPQQYEPAPQYEQPAPQQFEPAPQQFEQPAPEPDPAEALRSQASDILGLDIKLEQ